MPLGDLGNLPLSECYFIGAKHAGFRAGAGQIVIFHPRTGDVWSLSAHGEPSLMLARLVNGQKIPSQAATQIKHLRDMFEQRAGIGPDRLPSQILCMDRAESWAQDFRHQLENRARNSRVRRNIFQHLGWLGRQFLRRKLASLRCRLENEYGFLGHLKPK
jgi:hypothetical protein